MQLGRCIQCDNLRAIEYDLWPKNHQSKKVTVDCVGNCDNTTTHKLRGEL